MGKISKNAKVGRGAQKFFCPCGGEVKMKAVFQNGKMKLQAVCEKCKRTERRPKDFV
ncbi:hypothetical protein [Spirochaeta thermophila]|uniref:Uncharacterized protein n=2 Tax=Winmispira thermophila TaxID=154 RepID=G0GD86_WINT7|nr:hypothetical protein [Spirochaeta thermophila]ADN02794.1 hypothetical protein STHERM_c18590 [Spirochaeta thermophila DSM 6192]AEJ62161.1 hypothetical protein Spith_1903 [Spirochaeta thermophila DSM 6578]